MFERSFMARWLLIGGAALAVIGLVLWLTLPIPMSFPPYLLTAILVLGYGAFCLKSNRPRSDRKP
jgi:hypothetical protein